MGAWLFRVQLLEKKEREAFRQARDNEPVTSPELDYLLPDIWLSNNPSNAWKIDQIRREERKPQRRTSPRRKPRP